MLLTTWLVIVALATILTTGAVATDDDGVAIIAGIAGFITFGLAAFGAFNLEVINGGQTFTRTQPYVAYLMAFLSLIPGLIALTGPVEIVHRVRDTEMKDV